MHKPSMNQKPMQLPSLRHTLPNRQSEKLLIISSILILLHIFFSYMYHPHPISDEVFHKPMVEAMGRWDYINRPNNVTTPPIFHAFIGFITNALGFEGHDLQIMRLTQLLLSAIAIPCFYFIRHTLYPTVVDNRALICLFLPIYLPFIGLLYTDPPAVSFALLSILLMLKRQHWIAAFIATIGLGIRQLTVIWACFCALYTLLSIFYDYKERHINIHFIKNKQFIWDVIKQLIPYLIPATVFVAYSVLNKGIVSGDISAHKISINFSNLYLFLIISFFLLLPINIERTKSVYNMITSSTWWLIYIVIFVLVYLYQYKITHGYNHIYPHWFLHNMLLKVSTESPIYKILFSIPVTWMSLTFLNIAKTSRQPWQFYLIYTFGLLSFIPLPMGAIRYYMITILLFLLWCPKHNAITERASLVIFILTSYVLIYGQSKSYFFIS